MVRLTRAGRAVMKAEAPARLLLPEAEARPRPGSPSRRGATAPPTGGPIDEGLFEALRRHRLQLARDQGVPPYVVAGDRTLREIATVRPRSLEELGGIYGIGPTKVERYGRGFLDVVARQSAA